MASEVPDAAAAGTSCIFAHPAADQDVTLTQRSARPATSMAPDGARKGYGRGGLVAVGPVARLSREHGPCRLVIVRGPVPDESAGIFARIHIAV